MVCAAGIQRVSVQMAMHLQIAKRCRDRRIIPAVFYGIGEKMPARSISLKLPGLCNVSNAAAALSAFLPVNIR